MKYRVIDRKSCEDVTEKRIWLLTSAGELWYATEYGNFKMSSSHEVILVSGSEKSTEES